MLVCCVSVLCVGVLRRLVLVCFEDTMVADKSLLPQDYFRQLDALNRYRNSGKVVSFELVHAFVEAHNQVSGEANKVTLGMIA